jgi:hypothetical protein
MSTQPSIPLLDARADPIAQPDAARELQMAILGRFKPLATPFLPLADRIARRWLARAGSPYLDELDAIAARTGLAGVYATNVSYEYACTVLAQSDGPSAAPMLRRTLDWPFPGLGRHAVAAWRAGPAGEFLDLTWPGFVGVLTALAPGRFAAAINQAPLYRRTEAAALRGADYVLNLVRTLSRERGLPPAHALRRVFETAPDFAAALAALRDVEIARPALFTLIGPQPGEMAVIERRERDATVLLGPGAVANDWREPRPGWEPRPCALEDRRLDSVARCAAITANVGAGEPFGWVAPPVRNWNTRLAVEINVGEGLLRAQGYEPVGDDALPATRPCEFPVQPSASPSPAETRRTDVPA